MATLSPAPVPPRRPRRRVRTGRVRLVGAGLIIAVVGGAAALALALLVGAVHTGSRGTTAVTTVVQAAPVTPAGSATTGSTWASIARQADAGAVDITVQETVNAPGLLGTREVPETVLGSGFVLNAQGDILTAEHVIADAGSIKVSFENGAARTARVVGRDAGTDVAVLHVDPSGLTLRPLPLGNSGALAAGDPLAVLGDPLGFDRSLSTGVVSAVDRTIEAANGYTIGGAIQTDAAMNPGNSGGPLFNARGQVVGIADQIAVGTNQFGGPSSTDTSTGVGFAVPIDLIKPELFALEHGRSVSHAYLGIGTGQTASGAAGALVASVRSGSPAAAAGLKAGDVIVAFGATAIGGESALIDALARCHPGQRIHLIVLRGTRRLTLTVTLGTQPAGAATG